MQGAAKGLTDEEEVAFVRAYEANDMVTMRAIVIAAIAGASEKSTEILEDAYLLAPEHADSIAKKAAAVFPSLKDRILAKVKGRKDTVAKSEAAEPKTVPPEARPHPAEGPAKPVEKEEEEPRFGMWSGETAIGGSYKNSVQKTYTANAEFKIEQEIGKWENSAGLQFDYGRVDKTTNTHLFRIEARTQRALGESLYAYGLGSYEDDRFSGFEYQITEGVGLGYQLFDLDTFSLDVEGGPSIRQSRVEATGELHQQLLGRFATNLNWDISDTASFSNETALLFTRNSIELNSDIYGGIRDTSETVNTSALDLQIVGNLAARLGYEFHYRSNPPDDGQSSESIAKISLIHRF